MVRNPSSAILIIAHENIGSHYGRFYFSVQRIHDR